jgi:hypothetical protein
MKNHFKQRIPGYIDPRGIVPVEFEFTKTEELLEHPHIKRCIEDENTTFLKQDNMIIVRYFDGDFVIGWVKNPDDVELPLKYKNDQLL